MQSYSKFSKIISECLKKWDLSTLYVSHIYVIGKDVGQYFQNILSGDKDFANKHIRNTNTLGFS